MTNRVSAKNKKIYEELIHQSYCDVCFDYFRKVPPKKINEGQEVLICAKCHCKTHRCCYDLSAKENFITDKIREFVCDKCNDDRTNANKQCFICHQSDGALTVTQDKQFVHVFCALYHNQIDIISYTPKIKVQKSVFYTQNAAICEICRKPNAFESCAFENCKKTAHPYCVKKLYVKQAQQSEQPKCWNHHLACAASNQFDLSDELIPYTLLRDTINQELQQVEERAPFQIPNKEQIIKKIYNEYLQQAKKQKRSSKKIKRGGYSFISCTEHQYSPHCICQGLGQDEMIECETCLTWYHMGCIKYKAGMKEEPFSCTFCRGFYELKKKIVEEVIGQKNQTYEIKCDLPPKMTFMDVMWIMRAIDTRIAKGNVAKMIKQLVKYPLRTSKMDKLIKIQNKNKLQILLQEFLHQYFFSDQQFKHFKPYAVLGLDSNNKPIKLEQNIQRNKQLRDFVLVLKGFCKKQGIVDQFKAVLTELDFKENAICDSYEKIIELSKSQQKYQEVGVLKIKAQAYSFLQIVKKVNSGSIITINQLQQSVRKASLIQNVPEYLTQPLTQKHQKVKIIINNLRLLIQSDPYNLIEIKQTAAKLLSDYKIEPPLLYELYLEERNFTNTLYFYQVKQTGGQIQAEASLKFKLEELKVKTGEQTFKCSEQLVRNLNSFLQLRLKSGSPPYAFSQLQSIISNLQKKTIQFSLKDPLTKTYRKQKLQYLFRKVCEYQIQDEIIEDMLSRYTQIDNFFGQIVMKGLENVTNFDELNKMNEQCMGLIYMLENYPLKIEQEVLAISTSNKSSSSNKIMTWLQMARIRKDQITQLITLAKDQTLEKNPLSIHKLLQTIPKQNPLIKRFKQMKKQHSEMVTQFINMLALGMEKMNYFQSGEGMKKTRREQIQINDRKPDIKRFNQLLELLNQSKIGFTKEIRDITKIINRSLETSYLVQKFCKSKQTFEQKTISSDQLSAARKQIEQLRKKVLIQCEISLTKQLTQLYHSEIHNRMRTNLLQGNHDLDKNNKLLKFAQQEGIATTVTYNKLKEKLDSKNQKSKQINQIKAIEARLKAQALKDTDLIYKNLYNARKSLQIPDVQQQAPRIPYIQEHKQKNKQLKLKISKYLLISTNSLHSQHKATLQQAKSQLLQCLKNPYHIPQIPQLFSQVQKCHSFYTTWKRSHSLGRNTLYNEQRLKQYEKLKFRVEQLQSASKEIYKMKGSVKILETVENVMDSCIMTGDSQKDIGMQNYYDNLLMVEEHLECIQDNQAVGEDSQMVLGAKMTYLKIWVNYLRMTKKIYDSRQLQEQQHNQTPNQSSPFPSKLTYQSLLLTFKKLRKLLLDCYFLLQHQLKTPTSSVSESRITQLRSLINFFQNFIMEIKFNYLQGSYNHANLLLNNWIDLDDLLYEIKCGVPADDLFFVYRPFEDLTKFKYRNLSGRTNNQLVIAQKIAQGKEQPGAKRVRPDDLNTLEMREQRTLMKKSSSTYQQAKQQQSSDQQQKKNPNMVTALSRKKIKQILSKNLTKNSQLKRCGSLQNQVKMIENQIFGQYHDDIIKYFQTSEKFQKLFIKLQLCPEVSKKLIKKQFQFKFIKLLVQNLSTIGDIENMMVNKIKEEQNVERFNGSVGELANKEDDQRGNNQSGANNNNVLEMLAAGNVKDICKKEMVDEMKKIKEGADKKKKKSKHRRRSRSRSVSPQAKFSQQSQQQNLPSYIQKQYALVESQNPFSSQLDMQIIPMFPHQKSQQPLLFDPQVSQVQLQDMQKKYPRGSTLKIKSATLQFFLKKKGKLESKINLYTQQDYKKIISELVDPGFTSLNIRKEKSDKEILDYLNKPSRKKYKFLVCWIEAESVKENDNLRELSEEANERHKIYGWQNQQIKVHVMSIKQFVQLTRFSSSIPNKTTFEDCVQMFDSDRMVCVIQYPAEKIYELKDKFKNFSDIEKVKQTFELSIPLPTYDTYEPIQAQNPFYPAMGDIKNPNQTSIKPMSTEDPLLAGKESNINSKGVQFEGWGSANNLQTQMTQHSANQRNNNPYQQIRVKMGFGSFSPIMSDQQQPSPSKRAPSSSSQQPPIDLAESLLKSFDIKEKFQIGSSSSQPYSSRNQRPSYPQYDSSSNYQSRFNNQYQDRPQKYYHNNSMERGGMERGGMERGGMMHTNPNRINPMTGSHNPMGGYNRGGFNNRGNGHHYNNNQNRYQNNNQPQSEFYQRGYGGNNYQNGQNNQFNSNRGQMPYQNRQNRNPMFNPMSNPIGNPMSNPMSNPINAPTVMNPMSNPMINPLNNPMNPLSNPMNPSSGYNPQAQNSYQNRYQGHGGNQNPYHQQ